MKPHYLETMEGKWSSVTSLCQKHMDVRFLVLSIRKGHSKGGQTDSRCADRLHSGRLKPFTMLYRFISPDLQRPGQSPATLALIVCVVTGVLHKLHMTEIPHKAPFLICTILFRKPEKKVIKIRGFYVLEIQHLKHQP